MKIKKTENIWILKTNIILFSISSLSAALFFRGYVRLVHNLNGSDTQL